MIFHLNRHLVRITDIKRSITKNDNYTSPSLDTPYKTLTRNKTWSRSSALVHPIGNFFIKIKKCLKLKLSQLNPQPTSTTTIFTLLVTSKMGNCFPFKLVFPLLNSPRPPIVEYRDECPICLKITSCWKKLHPSDGDQPPFSLPRLYY